MNKFLGVLDVCVGVLLILASVFENFWLLPKLSALLKESDMNLSINLAISYGSSILLMVLGLISIYIGYKSFSNKKEKFLKWAIGVLVINFLLGIPLYYISMLSIVNTTYQLTSSF